MPTPTQAYLKRALPKLEQLEVLARGKRSLLAQTHDYPDPDTIASALALAWLMNHRHGLQTQLGYGGIIGRAENRAMIKVLGIKMRKTTPTDFRKHDLVALLDTQPECGNHSVPDERSPDIIIDHHFMREREAEGPKPSFIDVGGDFGSTSTKVAELLRAADVKPPPEIATALFYGVKSDTANLARLANQADADAYLWLFPHVDNKLISEIENPQVPLDYFRVFNKAIERGKVYGNAIVADLGNVYTPDLCAELADRLLQVEGIRHAIATGWYEESLFISVRTRSRQKNAGKILTTIADKIGIGSAGGHGPMAGARIPLEGRSQRAVTDLRRKVIQLILIAFGQDPRHFTRIVSRAKSTIVTSKPGRSKGNGRSDGTRKSKDPTKGASKKEGTKKRPSAPPSRGG